MNFLMSQFIIIADNDNECSGLSQNLLEWVAADTIMDPVVC